MATSPPDPTGIDTPPPGDAGASSTEFQKTLLPWADLLAQSPPGTFAQLGKDIIATLAVLVGQGSVEPKLLAADGFGRLLTSGILNPSATVTQADAAGQSTVHLDDTAGFEPGMRVQIFVGMVGVGPVTREYHYIRQVSVDVITLIDNLVNNLHVGDVVQQISVLDQLASLPPLGQASKAQSLPVTLAVDQDWDGVSTNVIPVDIISIFGNSANPNFFPTALVVQPLTGQPPLGWQASSATPAFGDQVGVGNVQFIDDSAGTNLRLFSVVIDIYTAAAGATVELQDGTGAMFYRFDASVKRTIAFDYGGSRWSADKRVKLAVVGAAASARAFVTWHDAPT